MKDVKYSLNKLRDPKFYLENFCKIQSKAGGLVPFIFNEAQKDLINTVRKNNRVIILKARQIGFCQDPNTRVLTSNLEWVSLDNIKVGQNIIAVDENIPGGRGSARKFRTAIVENKSEIYGDAVKITFDNGKQLIATPEHKFLFKDTHKCSFNWKKVSELCIGDETGIITDTWDSSNYEDGWFGGIVDGEGSLSQPSRSGVALTVSQVNGFVWNRILKYAINNKINYRIEVDRRKKGLLSKLGSKEVNKLMIGNMFDVFKTLGKSGTARFRNRKFWEGKRLGFSVKHKIINIEHIGRQRMIDLQTSEKTYIAEGFVSHNSSAMVGYIYHTTITTPGITSAIIGYNADLTSELLQKVKTFLATTPPELRPRVEYNSKYEISFPTMGSKILVLPSSVNVGRGYTLHNVLCVSGETEILVGDGYTKKMKDIKVGDIVVAGDGKLTKVVKKWKKKNEDKLIELFISKNVSFKVTLEHKVKVWSENGGIWKEAKNITENDYLASPIKKIINTIDYLKIPIVTRCDRGGNTKKIDCDVKLDYNFGLFIGWYLAEGCVDVVKRKIMISIDRDEVKEVSKVIDNSILKYISSYSVSYSKKSRKTVINIYGRSFSNFIAETFGRVSKEMKIPDEVWKYGKDFCQGLIYGIFCGDGSFKNINTVILTSTTQSIINQVKRLLESFGIACTVLKNKSFRYGKQCRDRYDIRLGGMSNFEFRKLYGLPVTFGSGKGKIFTTKKDNEYVYKKILKIKEVDPEEVVYDLMVENKEHSFCNVIGILKNCTEVAFWENAEEKMIILEASVPPSGKLVIESTPNMMGDVYHKIWMTDDNGYAKKEYGWWWLYSEEEIELIRKRMNNPMKFAREYGLKFMSSGRSVFDQVVLAEQRNNVLKIGDKREIDKKEFFVHLDDGLRVYKDPIPDHYYSCGVDVSSGVEGGDFSVAIIWDRLTGEEVAMYRGLLPPDILANKLDKWGRKYNNALMVVEVNNHGLTTITALKNKIYPSMYFRQNKIENISEGISDKLGWKTTAGTRERLIDEFAQAIRDKDLTIHSKELIDEMTVFVYNDAGKMVPQKGYNDDCIFAAAIGFQGFRVMASKPLDQLDYKNYFIH